MKQRHVTIVAHQYWPTMGSATQRLSALVGEMAADGLQIRVLANRPSRDRRGRGRGPMGEEVAWVGPPETAGAGLARGLQLASFALGVIREGRKHETTAVISDPPPPAALAAWLLARRKKVPFVYYLADSWSELSAGTMRFLPRLAHPAIKVVEDGLLRRAALVVAVTPRMEFAARSAGAKNVVLVPNGVPLDVFTPVGNAWRPNASCVPFFLYAGNAGLVHGAGVFADAAELLWKRGLEFALVFMGYGMDLQTLSALRSRWPDRVFIEGARPTSTVSAAYRGAVGALSSLRPIAGYADARPVKTLSGLACGCPPVYAGSGEFADRLKLEGLGYVTEWSVQGAARSMEACLADAKTDDAGPMRAACVDFATNELDNRVGARQIIEKVDSLGAWKETANGG